MSGLANQMGGKHDSITQAMRGQVPVITLDAIALNEVAEEVQKARRLHAPMQSSHEAYAVILEEVEEFWEQVKMKREKRSASEMSKELNQIAAMALRARVDLGLVPIKGDAPQPT